MSEKSSYRILIISDIHDRIENVQKLVSKLEKEQTKIDFIFDCGDTVSVPTDKITDKSTCDLYIPKLEQIHSELSKIAPIFWVPGNHEPSTYFSDNYTETNKNSKNMHKKVHKISNNLYLIGLGGAIPILTGGKWDENFIPYKTLDKNKFKYPGYPYNEMNDYNKSDEIYEKDLRHIINEAKSQGGKDASYILLTHVGPLYTSTNYIVENDEILYLGSDSLNKILNEKSQILIDIHGHSHTAEGLVALPGGKLVLNPGAHMRGNYAYLDIQKNNEEKWVISDVKICYI